MGLNIFDLYTKNIGFIYNKQYNFRTNLGGLATLIIIGVLALFSYSLIKNMIDRSIPEFITDELDNFRQENNLLLPKPTLVNGVYELPALNITNSKKEYSAPAYFSLVLRDISSNKIIKIDPSFLKIEVKYIVDTPGLKLKETLIDYDLCSGYGPIPQETFNYLMLNSSYCIFGDFVISNFDLINEERKYIDLIIRKCSQESVTDSNIQCKTNSEITKLLSSSSLEFFFVSTQVNSTSFDNPVINQIQSRYHNSIPNTFKYHNFQVEVNTLNSYNGYLPPYLQASPLEYTFTELIENESVVRNTNDGSNKNKVFEVVISSSTSKKIYRRYYLNVIDQLASLGGFFYIIFSILFFFIFYFVKLRYDEALANAFYKIINPKYNFIVSLSYEKFLQFQYNRLIKKFLMNNKDKLTDYFNSDIIFRQVNKLKTSSKGVPIPEETKTHEKEKSTSRLNLDNIINEKTELSNNEGLMSSSTHNAMEMYFTLNRIENIFDITFEKRLEMIRNIKDRQNSIKYYISPITLKRTDTRKRDSHMTSIKQDEKKIDPYSDYLKKRADKKKNNQNNSQIEGSFKKQGNNINSFNQVTDLKYGNENNNIKIKDKINQSPVDFDNLANIDFFTEFYKNHPSNAKYVKCNVIYSLLKYECFNNLVFSNVELVLLTLCCCCFRKSKENELKNSISSVVEDNMNDKTEIKEVNKRASNRVITKKEESNDKVKLNENNDDNLEENGLIKNLKNKKILLECSKNTLDIDFDITKILSSIDEFETFKECYFDSNQVSLFNSSTSPVITYESIVDDHVIDKDDFEKIILLEKVLDHMFKRGEITRIEHNLLYLMGGWKELVNKLDVVIYNSKVIENQEIERDKIVNLEKIELELKNQYDVYDSEQSVLETEEKKNYKNNKEAQANDNVKEITNEELFKQMEKFNNNQMHKRVESLANKDDSNSGIKENQSVLRRQNDSDNKSNVTEIVDDDNINQSNNFDSHNSSKDSEGSNKQHSLIQEENKNHSKSKSRSSFKL